MSSINILLVCRQHAEDRPDLEESEVPKEESNPKLWLDASKYNSLSIKSTSATYMKYNRASYLRQC